MKNKIIYAGLSMVLLATSCTKKFEEINTDPTQYAPNVFDANYFLGTSERAYADEIMGYGGPILFQSGWAQVFAMATVSGDYYTNADKYVESSNTNSYVQSSWNNGYRAGALANEILLNHGDDPAWANVNAIATIMKVLSIQYITDTYGDAPYSQAWQARDGVTLPVYDKQQDIYTKALSDLEKALATMDPAKAKATADISSLGGDVLKWKRFGYSLMLRMAMRLVKRDVALAKTWAEKAYTGGTLTAADNVYFQTEEKSGYQNGNVSAWLVTTDLYEVRWSKTMIDYLKSVNDPRLPVVAEVPAPGLTGNNSTTGGDNTPGNQLGQPNGYDLIAGSPTNIANSPGYPGGTGTGANATPIGRYSRPNAGTYANRSLPLFVMSYAESELLLAEAAVRGFSVGANAATHYRNAVEAAVLAVNVFKPGAITTGAASTFALASPLDISSTANSLRMINTQYWATTGLLWNFGEAWINWKRSGYPALTPVNYAGNFSGGVIPRRQPYPTGEGTSNRANYQAAVNGINGGDKWAPRVWWDQ